MHGHILRIFAAAPPFTSEPARGGESVRAAGAECAPAPAASFWPVSSPNGVLQRFYHPTKKELSSLCSVLGHVGQSAAVVVCADLLFLLSLPYPWLFLVLVVGLLDMAQCHFRPVSYEQAWSRTKLCK